MSIMHSAPDRRPTHPTPVDHIPDGAPVTLTGIFTRLRVRETAQGYRWAIGTLTTGTGRVPVTIWPLYWPECESAARVDQLVTVTGYLDRRPARPRLVAHTVTRPAPLVDRPGVAAALDQFGATETAPGVWTAVRPDGVRLVLVDLGVLTREVLDAL